VTGTIGHVLLRVEREEVAIDRLDRRWWSGNDRLSHGGYS
jgi:hypothetical protein